MNEPENKAVLDVLAMRERRLDAALARETNAIDKLTFFASRKRVLLRHDRQRRQLLLLHIPVPSVLLLLLEGLLLHSALPTRNYEAEAAETRRRLERSRK